MDAAKNQICVKSSLWTVPNSVNQCPICLEDAGSVTICSQGDATLCSTCFDSQFEKLLSCPSCRTALPDRHTAAFSHKSKLIALNNSDFGCTADGCDWKGGYNLLDEHMKSCKPQEIDCKFDCGEKLPRGKMKNHKLECRKRPYKEGNLETNFETALEAKKLKTECLEFLTDKPLTQSEKNSLLDRLCRVYPCVIDAALTETSSSGVSGSATDAAANLRCQYQCGLIATTQKEFVSHFSVCPLRPVMCRHCSQSEQSKNLIAHEKGCKQRLVSCNFCDSSIYQGDITPHLEYCFNYPIDCNLCHNNIIRSQLKTHLKSACLQRSVTCNRCFDTTTAAQLDAHEQGCRFLQEIILPASSTNTAVTLVPQPGAIGSFYQPKDCSGDTSTIYLALSSQEFIAYLTRMKNDVVDETHQHPPFDSKDTLRCQYAGSPSTIYTGKGYYPIHAGMGRYRSLWSINIYQSPKTRKHHDGVWTSMEILNAHNQKIALLNQFEPAWGDPSCGEKMCVNNEHSNLSTGYLKVWEEARVLSHEFPSNLILVRFRHDQQHKK